MKYLFLLSCSFAVAGPVLAQEAAKVEVPDIILYTQFRDDYITVVASGASQHLNETGQSISVIGSKELASIQGPDLTRALERVPGVTLTRNGGPGSFTGARVRGADAEQLLVLVDGVRVADVASPAGGTDLGTLLAGDRSHI